MAPAKKVAKPKFASSVVVDSHKKSSLLDVVQLVVLQWTCVGVISGNGYVNMKAIGLRLTANSYATQVLAHSRISC